MTRWSRWVSGHPWAVLIAAVVLTAVCIAGVVDVRTGAPRIYVDPSADALLPAEGPERALYERARQLFGSDEPIVIALSTPALFTRETLAIVQDLTARLEQVEGVAHVTSLSTAIDIRSENGDLYIAPLLERLPEDAAQLRSLEQRVLANPLYAGTLVSRDARATALLVFLERMPDRELLERRIDDRVVEVAHEGAAGLGVWVSGVPHVKAFISDLVMRELGWMLPAIIGVLGVVLAVSFRSVRGVVIPLATIGLALVWTLGVLGWTGQNLNLVTTAVPPIILTVGFTYAIHVLADYYAEAARAEEGTGARELAHDALRAVGMPVLVTGITTAAGFLSLALSPIVAIREFGLFSLLGVGATVLAALSVAPALLALLRPPRRAVGTGAEPPRSRIADLLGEFSLRHRRGVIASGFVLLAITAFGMTRIHVAAPFPAPLDPASPVIRDYRLINEHFAGANEIRVLLETDAPGAFAEPDTLREVRALQDWLEAQPEVGATRSLADYVMLLHRAFRNGDPDASSIPESRRFLAQLLLIGGSRELQRFTDASYETANVVVSTRVSDSDDVSAFVNRLRERLAALPDFLDAHVTGSAVLLTRVLDDVARGQLMSLLLAFGLIYLVLAAMFTSFRVGLLALFPNVLPIAAYYGVLGWSGVTLNPSTSLVGCLALGIAVDDTIHYFARFNTEARRLADERKATLVTLRSLLRPVTLTTVGLVLGFLVLTASENRNQLEFGMLSAFTLGVAWLVDVTLTPALCSGVRIVTLWDVLRLDLGEEPQREIALFDNLSLRQARIFALMSDLVEVPAGARLLTEGEAGDDMFVVLEGRLSAWVEHDGRRVELSTMERGAVVGEVGYFAARRTANVDALTPVRLIRFDSEDLERLRRRYPRTAALVLRNLNRIQAERLVRTTQRVH